MKNRSIQLLVLMLGAILITGCHKLEATTKIEPNGSGELRTGVGFSAEEWANVEKQNNNAQDFCNTAQTFEEVTVVEERRGDETWCITITKFKDLEELRRLYEQSQGIRINRLEIVDGKFYFDIDLDTLSETSDFSVPTNITWSVVLPGAPIEHNADSADGNTLTWTVDPENENINLRAESEVPNTGFTFPACGAVILVFVSALVPLLQKKANPSKHAYNLRR